MRLTMSVHTTNTTTDKVQPISKSYGINKLDYITPMYEAKQPMAAVLTFI